MLLVLILSGLGVEAQTHQISGTVNDAQGPLAGATVYVKGSTNGTITDFNGNWKLEVNDNDSLTISYMGYQSTTIAVDGKSELGNVTLEEDVNQLTEEIVVVGYGQQRKEAVTGSVSSVKGDEIRSIPGGNISQNLQGRIAGVEMQQSSSKPGAEMQIRIRGTRSLNASNDPLVVLDGIPFAGKIGDINPSSIKSIDILKDASATAIYGSRGANGVIIVTTDKGNTGQKAKVSYSGYYGIKTLFAEYPMMSGDQLAQLRIDAGSKFKNSLQEADGTNTDWQDLTYQNSFVTNHDVNITGGTDKSAYSFGLGYYQEGSLLPEQDYKRFSARASIDQKVKDHFKFGLTTNNNYSITNGANYSLYDILSMSPLASPYDENGELRTIVKLQNDDQAVKTRDVMDLIGDGYADVDKVFGTYNSAYGEVECPWVDGLKYRLNVGFNLRYVTNGEYVGQGVFSTNASNPASSTAVNEYTSNWTAENLVTYDKTFGKHTINAVAMLSNEGNIYNTQNINVKGIGEAFQYYNLGNSTGDITIDPEKQSYQKTGIRSYMGRIMYNYDDRYMLSVAVRSDGSSRLAKDKRWHTYPAISAGWNIANEDFMKDFDWLSSLKIRVGYGETSNQSVDPYKTLGKLSIRPYNFDDEYIKGLYVSEAPNDELGWEYSSTINVGLDFGFFKNRLTGSFEYYVQNTKDVLLSVNLPGTAGVSKYMANIGETQNKGWELNINGTIIDKKDFGVEAGFNIYGNKNELVSLASGQKEDKSNWWFVGHPIDVIYDFEYEGIWQEGDPYLDILEPGGNVGMIKVKYTGDYNADGTPVRAINDDDKQIIDINPKAQGGFNIKIRYKGFDLSTVGAFKIGGKLISTLHTANGYLNMLSGRRGNVDVDYWTPTNTSGKYPLPGGVQSGDNPKYGSTLGYFDATYCKLRTITLGYNFDNIKGFKNSGIDNMRIYFTVQNPFVIASEFTKETGLDPETNSFANENAAVTTVFQSRLLTVGTNTPQTRNFIFGINFSF